MVVVVFVVGVGAITHTLDLAVAGPSFDRCSAAGPPAAVAVAFVVGVAAITCMPALALAHWPLV